jgi:hypothetical protein
MALKYDTNGQATNAIRYGFIKIKNMFILCSALQRYYNIGPRVIWFIFIYI